MVSKKKQDGRAFRAELETQKSEATLQVLFKVARLANEYAVSRVRLGHSGVQLRAAHTALLAHIDLEGTRLSVVAERAGISKQALGQLVDDLERLGSCERIADPTDGRAKLVRFTKRGRSQLLEGLAVLRSVEQELAQHLGAARLRALNATLTELLGLLQSKLDSHS